SQEGNLDTLNQKLIESTDRAMELSRTVDERAHERDIERQKVLNLEAKVVEAESQRDTEASMSSEWKEKAELAESEKKVLHRQLLESEQARAAQTEKHLKLKHQLTGAQTELKRSNDSNSLLEQQYKELLTANQNQVEDIQVLEKQLTQVTTQLLSESDRREQLQQIADTLQEKLLSIASTERKSQKKGAE
ncbi:hypothetical protein QTO17_23705, partial [Vibrio owensii]